MARYDARQLTADDIKRMARMDVAMDELNNTPMVVLSDGHAKSDVVIVPSIGHQCVAYQIDFHGVPLDIIDGPPSLEALRKEPIFYGNPILFPFPSRIARGTFRFEGREYTLPINDPQRGHAIHGFVYDRPWALMAMGADDESAFVTANFVATDFPGLIEAFPFPFCLEYTYRLKDGALHHEITAINEGDGPMPMGFGLHPWFPAPLSPKGDRARCRISAPVDHIWELDDLPTGRIVPAPPEHRLSRGIELGTNHYDTVYAGLGKRGSPSVSTYVDPGTGVDISVIADESFQNLVVYAPTERHTVCIEPLTCTADAFNLHDRGVESGMMRLNPGEQWSGRVVYRPSIKRT